MSAHALCHVSVFDWLPAGMLRLLVLSAVLLLAIGAEFGLFCVEEGVATGFAARSYIPEWLGLGLMALALHAVETAALLYICAMASRQFVRQDQPGAPLRDHLHAPLLHDDGVPLVYRI